MRVHVVSDVHGNVEALARAGEGADALVVLGDLLDFVDYDDPGAQTSIFGRLFGEQRVRRFADLRKAGDRAAAGQYARELWGSLDDPVAAADEAIREQYEVLFAAMMAPTYATPGNVDAPELWPEFAGNGVTVLDGEVTKIGGLSFGFIGGAMRPPWYRRRPGAAWGPYLRSEEELAAAAEAVGRVDVLCSHIPPASPELTYDVVARGFEDGSEALRRHVEQHSPRWSVFGHIHQPLTQRMRVGKTECCNVGHFKRSGRPFVLRW